MSVWDVQKAIYTQLQNDSALGALVTGIYDYVPDNTVFPYMAIRLSQVDDVSGARQDGYEMRVDITVYSKQSGSVEAWTIFDRLYALLHNQPIATDNTVSIRNIRMQQASLQRRESSELYELNSRFRLVVTPLN